MSVWTERESRLSGEVDKLRWELMKANHERDEARGVAREMHREWVCCSYSDHPQANSEYDAYLAKFPWLKEADG